MDYSRYNLILVGEDEAKAALVNSKGGSGGGDLITYLETLPLAKAQRDLIGNFRADAIHLSRFSKTDYVSWYGRGGTGMYYPFGNIMKIIKISRSRIPKT